MLKVTGIHHIAIICSDYKVSKKFYTDILGFTVVNEVYREQRHSWKLDLSLNNQYTIELFSFPNPPQRVSMPEAAGLRHIAFKVDDLDAAVNYLHTRSVITEPVRTDEITGKRFTFFPDPDGLPVELYES